ncbi:hemolysin III family protein [Laribacter hongkongensis]|uniref:Probable hemolysin III n=1 Tax=Laribacter hongkongensis (strain HLHK9) TaxID=557598 RepID=C1D5D1_LARHH|nr:hemolysin III family protein [Laribacter hongkongensis]ACO73948.1 probable hemolysin III [Laribacter hongkongensis HLHK9]MCG8994198.1 hemolysin III family protein [Laribacter hongkongensis]MCG9010605.1 hemolysin III family protein [Laribacter hongkongensis]MCG9023763.1 hemolysin III family protein [Laribacter hongkongensis]MCG9046127.1 hemolysin III family protein [Laribacter hongkongensis]
MYYGERFNAISHMVGAVASIGALVTMVVIAAGTSDPYRVVGASVFGATLVLLYVISTLYHSVKGRSKNVLQKFDHCAIYLLIAGSYTPYALVTLQGTWGWTLFGLIWGLAAFGIVQEVTISRKSQTRWLSLLIYLVMGWLVLIAIKPLIANLATAGLVWLVLGGLVYSIGVYWFINDEKIRHGHGIWHLFVLGGSLCMVISVVGWVL